MFLVHPVSLMWLYDNLCISTVQSCSGYSIASSLMKMPLWMLSIPLLSKIKIPSLSILEVSSCKAAGCTERLSNRCLVEKKKKRIFLTLTLYFDESIKQAWIKVHCEGKCSLEKFVIECACFATLLTELGELIVPASAGRQNDREARALLFTIVVEFCPHTGSYTCTWLHHNAEKQTQNPQSP